MGGVPQITFTEEIRSRMCFIIAIINWISILTSLMIAGIGAYIKLQVQEFTSMVAGYDGTTLPYLLIAVGMLSALINAGGGFLIFFSADPVKRFSLRHFLFGYVVTTLFLSLVILAGGFMCFAHISHLDESFKGGLSNAMTKYKDNPHIKTELDLLQQKYQCCGSDKYTDWFHLSWINEEYINVQSPSVKKKMAKGAYKSDDVPFSCCAPQSHRPCIHHHVHDNSRHYNYDFRAKVTVHTKGCRDALMDYLGSEVLKTAGIVVLSVFLSQLILATVARLLQTSLATALELEDPLGPSPAYLFPVGDSKPEEPSGPEEEAEDGLTKQKSQGSKLGSKHNESYEVFDDSTWDDVPGDETMPLHNNSYSHSMQNMPPGVPPPP